MNRFRALTLLLLLLLVQTPAYLHTSTSNETVGAHPDFPHARVVVTRVVDGDTVHITPPVCVAGAYRTVVRLADIDAPEPGQPNGEASRSALIGLLAQYGNIVYLDIANYTREAGCTGGLADDAGRAVAVVYVRVNSTHLLNVNKWMVEYNHANISDFPDSDFNPAKWSLYLEYHVTAEKLPVIDKVVICENCNIAYNTTWGIRVGVSPDRRYLAIAYSIHGVWRLNVNITDSTGAVVRSLDIIGTSLHVGYTDIAANDTGLFVTWRDHEIGPHRARFVFIPYDPEKPIYGPADVFSGSWHGAPIAVWNPYNNTWVVVYGHQTMWWRPRHFINFVSPAGSPAGGSPALWLSPFGGSNRTGHDILGGLVLDHNTRKIAYVARNESPAHTYNIEVVVFPAVKLDGGLLTTDDIKRVYVDYVDTGGRGPEPSMFNETFTRFMLWPSIYTKLLGNGRYLLTVYNDTSTSLSYAIVDIAPDTPSIVIRDRLVDRGVPTTFYPWITANDTHWLVAWSAGGWVNASFVKPSEPFIESYIMVADNNASYVRVAFDGGSNLYAIVYAVTDHTGTRNIYLAFYNATKGLLEPWILPVATTPGIHETPLYVVVLAGSPNRIVVVALEGLEGGNLVAYYISPEYPELLNPIPIPEPWFVAAVVVIVAFITLVLFIKKARIG